MEKVKRLRALGLALRAVGHGLKVLVIQFMKGKMRYGEFESAQKLSPHLTIKPRGTGYALSQNHIRIRPTLRPPRRDSLQPRKPLKMESTTL